MTAGPRGPTAGLTVERLAALLREYGALVIQGREHDADRQAAWLLPRLAAVSPGAAARRAPTDAMIDAAFNVGPEVSRAAVVEMLRAALAATSRP